MEAYVITQGDYSDYRIVAVFLDKAEAEAFLEEYSKCDGSNGPELETWKIGRPDNDGKVMKQYWQVAIDPKTGEFVPLNYGKETGFDIVDPNLRCDSWDWAEMRDYHLQAGQASQPIQRRSYVSREHAEKLCVEARQARLAWWAEKFGTEYPAASPKPKIKLFPVVINYADIANDKLKPPA